LLPLTDSASPRASLGQQECRNEDQRQHDHDDDPYLGIVVSSGWLRVRVAIVPSLEAMSGRCDRDARIAANMAVLDVHHPDVEAFITAKRDAPLVPNFNLSVAADDVRRITPLRRSAAPWRGRCSPM
jgi:hypothetical protein